MDDEPTDLVGKARHYWSYVILAAAVLSHAIGDGFSLGILGTFTIEQAEYFNVSLDTAGCTGAIHLSTSILAGE